MEYTTKFTIGVILGCWVYTMFWHTTGWTMADWEHWVFVLPSIVFVTVTVGHLLENHA